MSAGSVGGFRAREEAEKQKREQERAAAASRQAQQSEAGRAAHREAVLEAYKRGKETPGAQTSTVRTDFTKDTASSTVKTEDRGRSSSRDRRQFSQSGDPVNLQGDKQAIQEVRAKAFQQAREKAARSGTKVDEAAVNRETRNILAASGGNVSVVDRAAQKRAINEAYSDFKRDKSIPESDMAIMTPVRGIRSRSTYEGFFEGGGRTTVSIGAPKVTKEVVDLPPPPDNFFEGAKTNLQNLGVDLELGARGAGIGIGSLFSFANPNAQKNLIKDVEKQGRIAESKTGRELEREFIGSAIETGSSAFSGKPSTTGFSNLGKDIIESPSFFAGSAASSAAVYLTPFGISKLIRNIQNVRYGFSFSKPLGKRIPEGAQDVAVEDYGAFMRGEIPIRSGSPAEHYRYMARLNAQQADDARRFNMPELAYPYKKPDRFSSGPVIYSDLTKPFTSTVFVKAAGISPVRLPATIASEIGRPDVPLITASRPGKRITTLADIDKRLGLDVKDRGDFSEVRTRTGQVLLVKKPIQIQKPLVITKQETVFAPQRAITRTTQKQQSRSIQQFMLGFGGQTGAERVIAKRLRQRQGLLFNTPQIEREALQQAQGLTLSQQSLFGQRQSFKQMFRQNQITKMLQKQQFNLKFQPLTIQQQKFRFDFPRPTRTTTTTTWPPFSPPGTPPPSPPRLPPFRLPPMLGFGPSPGKKEKRGARGSAVLREFQIKDLISVALGDSNKFAKRFNKRFGKLF